MRASNREKILEGVAAIIERDGVTAITFDAVAAQTGLTRGGLIYHFRSREELIQATHEYLAAAWERRLLALADNPDDPLDRYAAYVRASMQGATRGELQMLLESVGDAAATQAWMRVMDRWAPPLPGKGDGAAMAHFLVRLAADGMWMLEASTGRETEPSLREEVCAALLAMIHRPAAP